MSMSMSAVRNPARAFCLPPPPISISNLNTNTAPPPPAGRERAVLPAGALVFLLSHPLSFFLFFLWGLCFLFFSHSPPPRFRLIRPSPSSQVPAWTQYPTAAARSRAPAPPSRSCKTPSCSTRLSCSCLSSSRPASTPLSRQKPRRNWLAQPFGVPAGNRCPSARGSGSNKQRNQMTTSAAAGVVAGSPGPSSSTLRVASFCPLWPMAPQSQSMP